MPPMMANLELVAANGLLAAGLAGLFRALPWSEAVKARKPWSCVVCLAGHGSWLAMLVLFSVWPGWRTALEVYFGSLAIAAVALHYLYPPDVSFS